MKKARGTERSVEDWSGLAMGKYPPTIHREFTEAAVGKPSNLRQHPCHFQGGLRGFHAAIVFRVEAARFGLLLVFQQQHFMDHGHAVLDLNLSENCQAPDSESVPRNLNDARNTEQQLDGRQIPAAKR